MMTRVSDIMSNRDIQFVTPEVSVRKAAKAMRDLHRGCLVVIDEGKLVGIVTERDLVQKVVARGMKPDVTLISAVMSKPVVSVKPETSLTEAAEIMARNGIRRLAVAEGSRIVGILTVTDFAKYMRLQNGIDPMWAAAARAADYQTILE